MSGQLSIKQSMTSIAKTCRFANTSIQNNPNVARSSRHAEPAPLEYQRVIEGQSTITPKVLGATECNQGALVCHECQNSDTQLEPLFNGEELGRAKRNLQIQRDFWCTGNISRNSFYGLDTISRGLGLYNQRLGSDSVQIIRDHYKQVGRQLIITDFGAGKCMAFADLLDELGDIVNLDHSRAFTLTPLEEIDKRALPYVINEDATEYHQLTDIAFSINGLIDYFMLNDFAVHREEPSNISLGFIYVINKMVSGGIIFSAINPAYRRSAINGVGIETILMNGDHAERVANGATRVKSHVPHATLYSLLNS